MDEAARKELDALMDKADRWSNTFNLANLGHFILEHPELVGRELTARQIGDREYRTKRNTRSVAKA